MILHPPHPYLSYGRGGAATDSEPADAGEDFPDDVDRWAWSAPAQIAGASTVLTQGPSGSATGDTRPLRSDRPAGASRRMTGRVTGRRHLAACCSRCCCLRALRQPRMTNRATGRLASAR